MCQKSTNRGDLKKLKETIENMIIVFNSKSLFIVDLLGLIQI
jgi:hypothetical protein